MRLSLALATLPVTLLAGCVTAPAGRTRRAANLAADRCSASPQTLSSDDYQGRAPGTRGRDAHRRVDRAEFERAGLQPGNNGSWYQDVPLVEISAAGQPGAPGHRTRATPVSTSPTAPTSSAPPTGPSRVST